MLIVASGSSSSDWQQFSIGWRKMLMSFGS
jgi:hypothetical protein